MNGQISPLLSMIDIYLALLFMLITYSISIDLQSLFFLPILCNLLHSLISILRPKARNFQIEFVDHRYKTGF